MSLLPIVEEYNTSLGGNYNGQPKMPKAIAEERVLRLQEELTELTPETENYQQRADTLNREIQETQDILNNQTYTEDAAEIEYWSTYNQGLHQFIINSVQAAQNPQ
jgi:hypothetical protein